MKEKNLEEWVSNLTSEWVQQLKDGGYSEEEWVSFLEWYISEDSHLYNTIIESHIDNLKSIQEQNEDK